jgi:hypothetical protein
MPIGYPRALSSCLVAPPWGTPLIRSRYAEDINGDGSLSVEEIFAYLESYHAP